MGRLKELRKIVDQELLAIEDADKRKSAYVHLYGVSLSATLISEKRKTSTELACMAAMLHDLYAYKSGSYEDHAHKGAELARNILNGLGLTTAEETEAICAAISRHDDKHTIDGPLDEVLKDADVMHHCLNDLSKPVKDKEIGRYAALRKEFGLH
ncbi:MAG: HD domain-containing protein [Desulfovibrio sp.]|nr:HD domain-containing protein [Desulfovibrio sp.]